MNSFRRSFLIYAAFAVTLAAQSGSPKLPNPSRKSAISSAVAGDITTSGVFGVSGSGGSVLMRADGTGMWVSNGSGTVTWGTIGPSRPIPSGPPVTLTQVKMSAALLNRGSLPSSSYLKVAASIGLKTAVTDEARILQAIDRLGLTVYDFGKVDSYLYREAKKQGEYVEWVWKPLRDEDHDAIKDSGPTSSRSGTVRNTVYGNLIPEQVLGKAAAIMEAMPGVVFLVTDYEAVKPDPFLAITTIKLLAEGKLWIVEQWDEPGFGSPPARSVTPANQRVAYNVIQ